MNDKIKNYVLSHWNQYNMVDSQEEMVEVLNILEAHDENLDTLHDVVMGNTKWLCGIWINSHPQTDREVKDILYEYNIFYRTYEELKNSECLKEYAENFEMDIEEYCEKYADIRKTSDGFVRVLYY